MKLTLDEKEEFCVTDLYSSNILNISHLTIEGEKPIPNAGENREEHLVGNWNIFVEGRLPKDIRDIRIETKEKVYYLFDAEHQGYSHWTIWGAFYIESR